MREGLEGIQDGGTSFVDVGDGLAAYWAIFDPTYVDVSFSKRLVLCR